MKTLSDVMGDGEVEHLGMKEVVDVEHHLGQEPILCRVEGCVDEITSHVRLDGQRQEVFALGVDVEVSTAGGSVTLRF